LKVWEQGRAITPITLKALMRSDPDLASLSPDYFVGLAEAAPAITNVKELARIVHEAALRRELFRIGEGLANDALENSVEKPPKTIMEDAEKALYKVAENSKYGEGPLDFHESLKRAVENAERAQARGGRISGLATGFTDIDSLLGGLQPSDLIIL